MAISFSLPSRGMTYREGHPFYNRRKIYIKSMTAIEEDILLDSAYRKDGSVYDRVVSSMLIDPKLSIEEAKEVLVGDKQAIILSTRISAYGSQYEVTLPCPACNAEVDLLVKLNEAMIQEFTPDDLEIVEPNKFQFSVNIKNKSEVTIQFSFPTKIQVLEEPTEKPVLNFLREHIVAINGNTDKRFINTACEKFPIMYSKKIREIIESARPWMTIRSQFDCNQCGHSELIVLSCDHDLFPLDPKNREQIWLEPFFVLMYYAGWTWESYLNYPVEYRRWIISRINKEISRAVEDKQDIADKSPPHNTPDVRAMAGKSKIHTPNARMQRFT